MRGIALDHGQVGLLAAGVEAEPEPEPVGQRNLLLDCLAGMDGGAALIVDHLPRHQVAAVGGGVEQHVARTALDAALEHGLERFVAGLAGIEGEIVAEQEAAPPAVGQQMEQARQALDVLAVDLDQRQRARPHLR